MFLNENEYQHVIGLINGTIKVPPFLSDLQKWYKKNYNVQLYDFICDNTSNGLIRLRIVVWGYEDERIMKCADGLNLDSEKQNEIRVKFSELAIQYECYHEYQNPSKIFVCYETIEDEIITRILRQAESSIISIKHKDIWKIEIVSGTVHFFYETDEQITLNELNGTNELLNSMVTKIVLPHDKYKIFKNGVHCIFTSKQTFEEKFEGNMYYYLL